MNLLRLFALILAFGITQASAQQEVDPDHFDQQASKITAQHAVHPNHQHKSNHRMVASRHSGKSHRHHSHASA